MERENLVRFTSYPRPFVVTQTFCSNPKCRCNAAFLTFTEVSESGQPPKHPISFSIWVDLDSWRERQPPERPPEVTAWVREFLEQCPATRRAEYRVSYEEQRRWVKRKAQYTIDAEKVLDGELFSYAEILSEEKPLSAGGTAYTFSVQYRGSEYLVEDQYCVNPDCDCQSVHLDFYETVAQRDGSLHIYQRFHGRVTFTGELVVEETIKCGSALAKAVLSAWWKKHRHELEVFQQRYWDVKEIGQRSIGARPSGSFALRTARGPRAEDILLDNAVNQQPATVKVGRNTACPCGSGKKYKKCCLPKLATSL